MYSLTDLINPDLVGLEAVDHQFSTNFGDDLTVAINHIRSVPRITTSDLVVSGLSAIVMEHTGILVNFYLDDIKTVSAFTAVIDVNNVLYDDLRRRRTKETVITKMFKNNPFISGTVDFKAGRVSGDYSKIANSIAVGSWLFRQKKLTSEGIAATLLHEVFHILSMFAYLGEVLCTNFVMQDINRRAMETKNSQERLVLLKDIENVYGTTIEDKDTLANTIQLPDMYNALVLDNAVKKSYNDFGNDIYAIRAWEQMADAYVARFGYGKHLALALDFLGRQEVDQAYQSKYLDVLIWITRYAAVYYYGAMIATAYMILYTITQVCTIFLLGYALYGNPLKRDYDKLPDRIKKIKQQLADALKNPDIAATQRSTVLKDIEAVKKVLDKMNDSPTLYETLWKYVGGGYSQSKIIDMNLKIEELANNDMWIASAKLQELTSGTSTRN